METGIGAGTRMETETGVGNRGGTGQEKARSVGHDGKQRGRRRVRAETKKKSRNRMRVRKRWAESLGTGPVTANNEVNGHRFLREEDGFLKVGCRMPFPRRYQGWKLRVPPAAPATSELRYAGPMARRRHDRTFSNK